MTPSNVRLRRLTWAVSIGLIALWAAENGGGERFGVTALLLYLPQHGWGLPPLVLGLWALRRREFRLALVNALGLIFWAKWLLGVQFVGFAAPRDAPATLRLMTYNIARGDRGLDAIEATIRAQNPDIVCLQESQGSYYGRTFAPGARLAARFPGWHSAQCGDVMTLSRFPIVARRDYPLRGTRRILETTLQTPRGPVRLLNLHIATSFVGQITARHGIWGRALQIFLGAQPSAQTRLDQISPVRRAIGNGDSKLPLLVVGDFNSPPRGLFYRAISRGMKDAWISGGTGTGATFPAKWPLLPIDHALSRGLLIERAHVLNTRASDHRPLVIEFRHETPIEE